jgi:magnesium chelatase subunit D
LLDRFGLTVQVTASQDPAERAEVVRRRLAFEADPADFITRFSEDTAALAAQVAAARDRLPNVDLPDAALRQICAVCGAFGVDGMRADLVTARAAIALAAWHGRDTVTEEDIRTAARLALPHRRRRDPFDAPGLDEQALDEALREASSEPDPGLEPPDPDGPDDNGPDNGPSGPGGLPDANESQSPQQSDEAAEPPPAAPVPPAAPFRARLLTVPGVGEGAPGRRSAARGPFGRTVGARLPQDRPFALHLPATVRAAAMRGPHGATPLRPAPADLREAVREGREGNLVLFAVDASGSMAARQRMRAVKGAVLSLLLDAYQRRDKVGLVTFRGTGAELALPPTSSVEAAARRLASLATGGRTPLAAGLARAARVLAAERLRDPRRRALLVVVTDGRATSGSDADLTRAVGLLAGTASIVVDCEASVLRLGLAERLAVQLGATRLRLDELEAGIARQLARGPERNRVA